jgi:hypothetical protein
MAFGGLSVYGNTSSGGVIMTYTAPRRRRAAVGLAWTVACCCALAVGGVVLPSGGCDKGESHPAPPTTKSSKAFSDGPGPPGERQPGWAKGRVLREDGKPISVDDAKIILIISGVRAKDGEKINFPPPDIHPDGTYAQKLEPGTYFPITGLIDVPFLGHAFRYDLDAVRPSGGEPDPSTDASKGLAQDFVWKLSGPRPGVRPDEQTPGTRYGGAIKVVYESYREDLKRAVPPPPPGAAVVFTITPTSRLVDGREGQPKTFGPRPYNGPTGLANPVLMDIPQASYRLTAVEQTPDGKSRPLLLLDTDGQWRVKIEGTFQPDPDPEKHWFDLVKVTFTRPMEP